MRENIFGGFRRFYGLRRSGGQEMQGRRDGPWIDTLRLGVGCGRGSSSKLRCPRRRFEEGSEQRCPYFEAPTLNGETLGGTHSQPGTPPTPTSLIDPSISPHSQSSPVFISMSLPSDMLSGVAPAIVNGTCEYLLRQHLDNILPLDAEDRPYSTAYYLHRLQEEHPAARRGRHAE